MRTRVIAAALACQWLAGCASIGPDGRQGAGAGMASYHYQKSGDACEINITSGREVPGINAVVSADCAVSISAEGLSGEKIQLQQMQLINGLLQRIP